MTSALHTTLRRLPLRVIFSVRAFSSVPIETSSESAPTDQQPQKRFLPATRQQMYEGIMRLKPDSPPDSRVLRIGLLGLPGVGKSSLINRLTLFHACATSQKINTTRSKQNVAFTQGNTQLIFLDLPGLMSKRRSYRHMITRSLIRDPHSGIFQADLICVVVDVSNGYQRRALQTEILQSLHFFNDKPAVLILTKTDTLGKRKTELLKITRRLTTGVVGGVLSVKDRYAGRYRQRKGPDAQELLSRPETERLAEGHLAQLAPEEMDVILAELEAMRENDEERSERDRRKEEKEDEVTKEVSTSERASTAEIEAFFQKNPPMSQPILTPDSEQRPRNISEDGMLAVLREQMLLQSATRQEVANRVRRWHLVEEAVRGETAWPHFEEVFMVSAVSGRGIDRLRDYLLSQARPGPWTYHSSLVSDQDPHDTVRFAIRAQCLNQLEEEIPYELRFDITDYDDDPQTGSVFIKTNILCRTERQMLKTIGVGGSNIKRIATSATEDLEAAFGVKVHLHLEAKLSTIPKQQLRTLMAAKDFRDVFPNMNH